MPHEPHKPPSDAYEQDKHPSDAYEQFWAAVDAPHPAPQPAVNNPEPPAPPDAYEQFSSAVED
ncbi:MAG TPA: hypothetical protein VKE74_04910 [Gemmataceae bacterium]|nr:hypothetical protein [Gemmataceae bacterium]